MPHHRQVVRDEKVGQAPAALQVFHDVEHLRLHRHVKRRGRLVAHQKLGLGGQRAGDRDALALPARELVRILHHVQRRQAHGLEQIAHLGLELILVGDQPVLDQGLAHDVFHDPARIQAGIGILEDHLDPAAQLEPAGRLEDTVRVQAIELKVAARGRVQPHQQARHGALATARLADQRQRLAFFDFETHAIDRGQILARLALQHAVQPRRRDVERHGQVTRLHQWRLRRGRAHAVTPCWSLACSQHAARVAPASNKSGRSRPHRSKTCGQRGL